MNFTMQAVPDGAGGTRHVLAPESGKPAGKAPQRDPVNANPTAAAQQLKQLVERIENMEEEKAVLSADIREVYADARAEGYDVRALRAIIRLRRLDANTRAEADAILDTYKSALGLD